MFVMMLKDYQHIIPDLLNMFVTLATFLDPNRISLSILEGPSSDCSLNAVKRVLYPTLIKLGVPSTAINITTGPEDIVWDTSHRIELLAKLRNISLAPLWEDNDPSRDTPSTVGKNVEAVIYLNDVYVNAGQVLEMLHQHRMAEYNTGDKTSMTAALDYSMGPGGSSSPPLFRDVWVSRTVSETFTTEFVNVNGN